MKNFQKLIRDAKSRKQLAEHKKDDEKAKTYTEWMKALQGAEALLKGYSLLCVEGPSVDFLSIYNLALDHADRDPKVELTYPLPIARQIHVLNAVGGIGQDDCMDKFYKSKLLKFFPAEEIEGFQQPKIFEGVVGLLTGGPLSSQEAPLRNAITQILKRKSEFPA